MSIHILVPTWRLAELLKAEKLSDCLDEFVVEMDRPKEFHDFCEEIDDLLKTEDGLANHLGYQYASESTAERYANLEGFSEMEALTEIIHDDGEEPEDE